MGAVSISGIDYLIYGTEIGADNYFMAAVNGQVWLDTLEETRQKALVSATRWADQICLTDGTGAQLFPSATDENLPLNVEYGVYELALSLVLDSTAATKFDTSRNIRSVAAGSAKVEFFGRTDGTVFPTVAMRYLQPYIKSLQGGASVSGFGLAAGVDGVTIFNEANQPNLTEGRT